VRDEGPPKQLKERTGRHYCIRCLAEVTGTDLADLCDTVTATAQRTFGPW